MRCEQEAHHQKVAAQVELGNRAEEVEGIANKGEDSLGKEGRRLGDTTKKCSTTTVTALQFIFWS